MAHLKSCNIEFIDLTGVEENERNWILSSLHAWDPNVILPWRNSEMNHENHSYLANNNYSHSATSKKSNSYNLNDNLGRNPNGVESLNNGLNNNGKEENDTSVIDRYELPQQQADIFNNKKSGKSWASLFNNNCKGDLPEQHQFHETVLLQNTNGKLDIHLGARGSKYDDPNLYRMGEYLADYAIDNRITSLQPRGLINRSNYCYINSILQALLACPPLYNLLSGLARSGNTEKKKNTLVINSMARLVNEFHHLPAGQRIGRRSEKNQKKDLPGVAINCEAPFEPSWIYKILSGMRSDTFVVEGLQEDAEEFLGCLLNGLNDEMVELLKLVDNLRKDTMMEMHDHGEVDKEWQVMGPKNKGCVTRRTEAIHTPISDIFGGHLRSRIHRTGDQSTDNIQPFFTLPLNIEKVTTVREALEALVTKNQLEGVTSSKTNEEVEAWQQVTIDELPIVLILHLKCFDYKLDGCTKILKGLEFPIDLKVDSKLLSSKTNYSGKEKQYKLFAVVYHDGKEASKGHYITDAFHVGYASWLRYDDASVKAVVEEQVLNPHGTRVPYLLFYRRSDSVKSK